MLLLLLLRSLLRCQRPHLPSHMTSHVNCREKTRCRPVHTTAPQDTRHSLPLICCGCTNRRPMIAMLHSQEAARSGLLRLQRQAPALSHRSEMCKMMNPAVPKHQRGCDRLTAAPQSCVMPRVTHKNPLRSESKIGNNHERTIGGKTLVVKLGEGRARGETSWFVFDVQSFEFSNSGSHSKHVCFIATAFTEINKNFSRPLP